MSGMTRLPDQAIDRRRQLTRGAWDLYVLYCKHRNHETGRCDPSLRRLAALMERNYTYVSNCKTELVREGWIRRTGKNAVELLVGDFPPLKVQQMGKAKFGRNPNLEFGNSPKIEGSSSGEIRTEVREKSELHISKVVEPGIEPVVAAAAAAAELQSALQEPVTEEYVAEVIALGLYAANFVTWVWGKLKLHCATAHAVPIKKQLLVWLSTERGAPPTQPSLPGIGATLHEMPRQTAQPAKRCDSTCPRCSGTGWEIVAGRGPGTGARKCPAMFPPAAVIEAPAHRGGDTLLRDLALDEFEDLAEAVATTVEVHHRDAEAVIAELPMTDADRERMRGRFSVSGQEVAKRAGAGK